MKQVILFAGKVVALIVIVVAALWLIGASFRLSLYAGVASVVVVCLVMYVTADRWVHWLPCLLIFGVLNSLIALVTGHAPTSQGNISFSLSLLMLVFYMAGVFFATRVKTVTHVNRISWLLYLGAMVLPALLEQHGDGTITRPVAITMAAGMAAILISWTHDRLRLQRTPAR